MKTVHYDLIVVGAGVLGSFHAWHACKKGLQVLLLEKDLHPQEATVRNFGQVVPSGMSRGRWQQYGRRSMEIYRSIQSSFDISVRQSGSVYIASDETELTLLQELHEINQAESYTSLLLSQSDCRERFPGLRTNYCKGGLLFPEEITVEPQMMIHRVIACMQEQHGLAYQPSTLVTACEHTNGKCQVTDSAGRAYSGDLVVICNGRDFRNLYPDLFYSSSIEVSKLQMMKTVSQGNFGIKGSVLTGLSIRRYEAFRECPSYHRLAAALVPDAIKKWGIHILFKQAMDGGVIIGDSHEYASAEEQDRLGFHVNQEINNIIIAEAKKIFDLPHWEMAAYWNGYYAQCKKSDLFQAQPDKNIHIITAIGGKGMTASPGLAEEHIRQLYA